MTKEGTPQSISYLAMKKKWSTVSPFLLYMQHLFITITCHFLRLSKVRILPRAPTMQEKPPLKEPMSARLSSRENNYLQNKPMSKRMT
jgi:hypothetical protein